MNVAEKLDEQMCLFFSTCIWSLTVERQIGNMGGVCVF